MILYLYSIYFLADKGKKFVFIILIAYSVNVPQKKLQRPIKVYIKTHKLVISLIEWKLIKTQIFVIFSQPSQVVADRSPQARMSLNDVRFNSNWVFSSIMIIWKFILTISHMALLKVLYSILKIASWVPDKNDNFGKYLRCAEQIPKFFQHSGV